VFETQTDNNRIIIAKAVLVLLAVVAIVALGIRNIATGRVPHSSFILIVIMIFSIIGMLRFRATPLRLVFAMAAAQAAVRVALWLAHASTGWQRAAALSGEVVIVLAAIIAIFVIVKWLDYAVRGQPSSDREQPAS